MKNIYGCSVTKGFSLKSKQLFFLKKQNGKRKTNSMAKIK